MKNHKSDYIGLFGIEERFNYIMNGLYPPRNSSEIAFKDKWFTLPDMSYIVATCYYKVVVELANYKIDVFDTFFPIRGSPPPNPITHIMCLDLIPKHFVPFFFKMV